MTYDFPCSFRGEQVSTYNCGCGLGDQPVFKCLNEPLGSKNCVVRMGNGKHRPGGKDLLSCSNCDFRADPSPPPPQGRRPGDIHRARQRAALEENRKRATVNTTDLPSSPRVEVNHDPDTLICNMGAGGLGDAMLGLLAVAGLKKQYPEKKIVYRVGDDHIKIVNLFEGCDLCMSHDHDQDLASKPTTDLQLNADYNNEILGQRADTRIDRYCENIGAKEWVLPELLNREELVELGKEWAGAVVLSPFASTGDREYPLNGWLALERLLMERGHRVAIVDRHSGRCSVFKGDKAVALPSRKIVGALLNAKCVIGNDSGIPHLAGILKTKTIILGGQTRIDKIFNPYPGARFLTGVWGCEGCCWRGMWNSSCKTRCPSLSSILPERIVAEVENGNG